MNLQELPIPQPPPPPKNTRPSDAFLQVLYEHTILKNTWIPAHKQPHPKQAQFLYLAYELETILAGGAGSGKSAALLMAALQFVDVPGYHAIIFRRTHANLAKAGALLQVAQEWLHDKAKWRERDKIFKFPSGATLSFGYLDHKNDIYHYDGSNYLFIGFDEVTEMDEGPYTYMFSRLRRLEGVDIPLRVRCTATPGGPGAMWVKKRFITEGAAHGRVVIPIYLDDNPSMDRETYLKSLSNLDPIRQAQLISGDWDVQASGNMFRRDWFKIVDVAPPRLSQVRRWDLAGTVKKESDWTVGLLMGKNRESEFWILDIIRQKLLPAAVDNLVHQTAVLDTPNIQISLPQEGGAGGQHMTMNFCKLLAGFPIHFATEVGRGDKATRAQPFASMAMAQRVSILNGPWAAAFLEEVESFPLGMWDDQVDAGSEAFRFLTLTGFADIPTKQPAPYKPTLNIEQRRKQLGNRSRQRARGLFGNWHA